MSLSARCGDCGASYPSVPAKFAGKSIRCKTCGASVKIPKPAAAEADPRNLGDDLELEATPAPLPRSAPSRSAASRSAASRSAAPAKARKRKPGGAIPKWAWFVVGGAGACVLGCAGLFLVFAVACPVIARESVLRSEEAAAEEAIAVMEDMSSTLAGVNDASSALAAAKRIRGPLTERMEAIGRRLEAEIPRRAKLLATQKGPFESGEKKIEERLKVRTVRVKQAMSAESARLRSLPPDARRAISNALVDFSQRTQAAMPGRHRQNGSPFR